MRHLYILRYLGSLFWLTNLATFASAQPAATPAKAPATAPRVTLALGGGSPSEVTVTSEASGVVLHVGRLNVPVPLTEPGTVQVETVQLKGGATVGVVRLTAAAQSAAVLLVKRPGGALEALWTGRLQLAGDPGERRADALEIKDRDGDGATDVVVGSYDEQVRVCGDDRSLLAPRAIDPATLTLRSVLLNRTAQRPLTAQLTASSSDATLQPPPLLRALRAWGASSASQTPAQDVGALTDGDTATGWVEGRGLGGRFEFATLRWTANQRPILALAVVATVSAEQSRRSDETVAPMEGRGRSAAAPAETAKSHARVRVLSLLGPGGERYTATLPEDPKPGQRYWIRLPTPVAWSCMTLSIDDVFADQLGPQTHASIAEVEAYTDLDRPDGLGQLVSEIAVPGAKGDDATDLLQQARGDVVAALIAAWPKLPAIGKRRALRSLFNRPDAADARTSELLRSALRDADPEISGQALRIAASERVPFGAALLGELAHSATRQGDGAVAVIAHSGASSALDQLLTILLDREGPDRPRLREAIGFAYQARGEAASATIQPWLDDAGKPIAARAALALSLSRVPSAREVTQQLVRASSAQATEFSDQWRLVQAAAALPSDATVDGWLAGLAKSSNVWMVRAATLEALQQRASERALSTAREALADEYPRVRAAAIRVLAPQPAEFDALAKLLREDKWFLVKQALLDKLPSTAQSRQLFVEMLQDKTAVVRASAVQALHRVNAVEAWPQIKPLLENSQEYPEVLTAAVAFVHGLCVQAAAPSLRAVVARGMQPDAWTADQDLALAALEAMSSFGGDAATWARDHAVGPLVPKEVQAAAAAAANRPASCKIRTAL